MSGLTADWRYLEDEDGYADQVVVYPDHVAARFVAAGTVALLIRRLLSGRGGTASVAQLELILGHLATNIARNGAGLDAGPPDRPWGVYPARGDDNWLVVSVSNQTEWRAFANAIGRTELADDPCFVSPEARRQHQEKLDAEVAQWSQTQDAETVMRLLQDAGVPASVMLRVTELPDWPRNRRRGLFRTEIHPLLEELLIMETAPVVAETMAIPDQQPAPERGEHTREVFREWLGLDETAIGQLIDEDILEETDTAA